MKIEYFKSEADGLWYSHIVGGNGEVTHSSEGVHNKQDCLDTIQSVKSGALLAEVVEIADPNADPEPRVRMLTNIDEIKDAYDNGHRVEWADAGTDNWVCNPEYQNDPEIWPSWLRWHNKVRVVLP